MSYSWKHREAVASAVGVFLHTILAMWFPGKNRRGMHCFVKHQRMNLLSINAMPPRKHPPSELLWDAMRRRGWSVVDLADAMEGDRERNRALLSMLFRDRTGETRMGPSFAHRVSLALGLRPGMLDDLEREWFESRRMRRTK